MPASEPAEPKLNPSAIMEDQGMEMAPIVLGPAPYSSPDPATDGIRMLPLEEGSSGSGGETATEVSEEEAKEMKASEWKEKVAATTSLEELEAVADAYANSGSEYSTVDDAILKQEEELKAAAEGGSGDDN